MRIRYESIRIPKPIAVGGEIIKGLANNKKSPLMSYQGGMAQGSPAMPNGVPAAQMGVGNTNQMRFQMGDNADFPPQNPNTAVSPPYPMTIPGGFGMGGYPENAVAPTFNYWGPPMVMMPPYAMAPDPAGEPIAGAPRDEGMQYMPASRDPWPEMAPQPVRSPPVGFPMPQHAMVSPMMYGVPPGHGHGQHEQRDPRPPGPPRTMHYSMSFPEMVDAIPHLSVDQNGSRHVQHCLETCSPEELKLAVPAIIAHGKALTADPFGNYVVQKFLDVAAPEQRAEVAKIFTGDVLTLSRHIYGCRVIQKALELVPATRAPFLGELSSDLIAVIIDQHGNHVIQNLLASGDPDVVQTIIDAVLADGQLTTLAAHAFACRVIQRTIESGTPEQVEPIVQEIAAHGPELSEDRFGNYVVSHVLKHGAPAARDAVMASLAGKLGALAQHKFASNVLECCLHTCPSQRRAIFAEVLPAAGTVEPAPDADPATNEDDVFGAMVRDRFGNYVVQKMMDVADKTDLRVMVDYVMWRLPRIREFTSGRHVANRVERIAQEFGYY